MARLRAQVFRYTLAFLVSIVALLPWLLLRSPAFQIHYYLTLWPAILFSAWYCGLGPGMLSVLTTFVGLWYGIVPPRFSFKITNSVDLFGIMAFVLFAGFVVAIVEVNRRSHNARVHQAELLDVANDAIMELSATNDTILYWNRGAEKLYGWSKAEAVGKNVHALLHTILTVSLHECKDALRRDGSWEGEALHTRRDGTQINVAIRGSLQSDPRASRKTWLQICRDTTEKKRAEREVEARLVAEARLKASREAEAERQRSEEALRQLSVSLLRVQDQERRRIARELHDSAGQYLAMVKMSLNSARRDPASAARNLETAVELTDKCVTEVRTISHLLHPPLLEELGLASAVNWYVQGFGTRSGIKVTLDLPQTLPRLGDDVELVLFRVLQESLTNIHRHSGSPTAAIRMTVEGGHVTLEIRDEGTGNLKVSSASFRPGIGIAGMRERVKDLAGILEIASDYAGTCVRAELPISAAPSRIEESVHSSAKAT